MKDRELERRLKALANRRRLAIMRYLKKGEASVGDIADEIKLSFNATSKHLLVLSNADLVDKEQRSLQVFYRVANNLPESIRAILTIL